jgi:hypothetical protein
MQQTQVKPYIITKKKNVKMHRTLFSFNAPFLFVAKRFFLFDTIFLFPNDCYVISCELSAFYNNNVTRFHFNCYSLRWLLQTWNF